MPRNLQSTTFVLGLRDCPDSWDRYRRKRIGLLFIVKKVKWPDSDETQTRHALPRHLMNLWAKFEIDISKM